MPKYSYACRACGHRFEIQQAFSDDALTTCPECQGQLRKMFNAVGVVFKGSGFYRTDSRSSGSASSSSSGSGKSGASESSGGKEPASAGSGSGSSSPAGSGSGSSSTGTSSAAS